MITANVAKNADIFSDLYNSLVHEADRYIFADMEDKKPFSVNLLKSKGLKEVPAFKGNERDNLNLITFAFIVPILKDNGKPYTNALVRMSFACFHPGDPDLAYLYAIAINGRFSESKYDQVKQWIEKISALTQVEVPVLHNGYYWKVHHACQNDTGSALIVKVIPGSDTQLLVERAVVVNVKDAEGQAGKYDFKRRYVLYDSRVWYSRPELYTSDCYYSRVEAELCNRTLSDNPEYFLGRLHRGDPYLCVDNEIYGLSSAEVKEDCVRLLCLDYNHRGDEGYKLNCVESESNRNTLNYAEIKTKIEGVRGDKKPQVSELTESDLPATVMDITIHHPLVLGKKRKVFKEGETVFSKNDRLYGFIEHDFGSKNVGVILENGQEKEIAVEDIVTANIPDPTGDPLVNKIVLARSTHRENRLCVGRILEVYPSYVMVVLDITSFYTKNLENLTPHTDIIYIPKDYLVFLPYNFEPPKERVYKHRYFGDKETTPQAVSTNTWNAWLKETLFSYSDNCKNLTLYAIYQFNNDISLPFSHIFAVAELTELYFKKHRGQCNSPYMFMTLFKKLQALTDKTENITEILNSESHLAVIEYNNKVL